MKTKNETPTRVYRDLGFEETTKTDLQKTLIVLQRVLDIWNGLNLTACSDIGALTLNTAKIYGDAVNQLAEPPATTGRFQISKQAYINILEIPIPDELYRAARSARMSQYTGMPELWSVSGNQVVLNETEANQLIDSRSIYSNNSEKIELLQELETWVKLTNDLNEKLNGELFDSSSPITNRFFMSKFSFTGGDQRGCNAMLIILPEFLSRILQG